MKKQKIFFSVIIPTYNAEKFIGEALVSVLRQSYKLFEIIIVDNNSNDKTESIIKNHMNKKVKFFKIKNHGAIAKSRNYAIKKSKGNWIAFLDADDSWYSNRLNQIKKQILKNKFDVICSSELIIDKINNSKKIWHYGYGKNDFYQYSLKYGGSMSTSASVVRKNFLKEKKLFFDENKNFASFEDYDFFLNIAKLNGKIFFFRKVLGKHLFHIDATTLKEKKVKENFFSVVKKHVRLKKNILYQNRLMSEIRYNYSIRTIISNIFCKQNIFFNILKLIFKFLSNPLVFFKYIFYFSKIQLSNVERFK